MFSKIIDTIPNLFPSPQPREPRSSKDIASSKPTPHGKRSGRIYISKTYSGKPLYRLVICGNLGFQWMMTLYCLMGERRKKKIIEVPRFI